MNEDIRPPVQPVAAEPVLAPPQTPETSVPEPKEPASAPQAPAADSNVRMAIAATVVIVLGLGLLATYAYLKTK